MSYRLLSAHSGKEHDRKQWDRRTLEGELRSYEGRSITRLFDKYLQSESLRIIEGGCGFGGWCVWFEERGHSVVGVEYDEAVVAQARAFRADIPVFLRDVTNLMDDDNSFDAYVSLGVIEHFEGGAQAVLREAHRVLKPSGVAFITTPLLTPVRRLISHPVRSAYFAVRRLAGRRDYFWEYRFTEQELVSQVAAAGFDVVEVASDDYDPQVRDRHIGLWADWFFLRSRSGGIYQLNRLGRTALLALRPFPRSWYDSGVVVVARARE